MRNDRLCWDDMNMLLALTAAQRSPDPNTQVGAYICGQDNKPLGLGYNGLPRGIAPCKIPWNRESKHGPLQTKYPFIEHAERNAIGNALGNLEDAKLYVTLYPCNDCARAIIQAGIREVIFLFNTYKDEWFTKAAEWMFEQVDIPIRQHKWTSKVTQALEKMGSTILSTK